MITKNISSPPTPFNTTLIFLDLIVLAIIMCKTEFGVASGDP